MRSSASFTDRRLADPSHRKLRKGSPLERAIARMLVLTMLGTTTPGIGFAGDEFDSANQAVMLTEGSIVNDIAGQTTINSNVGNGATDWVGGFDQPNTNTLNFNLTVDGATHLNLIGGDETAHINGTILSGPNDTIVFASPYGVFIGSQAVINVGNLVAAGADLTNADRMGDPSLELTGAILNQGVIRAQQDVLLYGTSVVNTGEIYTEAGQLLMLGADSIHFLDADTITEGLLHPVDFVALLGQSSVINIGTLEAQDAALIGRRVLNTGKITIDDGMLMMIGGDAVHLRRFDDPIVITLPNATNEPANYVDAGGETPAYAVENRGSINAGSGRVRLAAADALGWGIRQRGPDPANTASITAQDIEIAGGEFGRVELSGILDATDLSAGGIGGEIEVTGETIVLIDALVDASGSAGGGTIHIGGEQQGRGELQRARALIVDEDSEVRADAITNGDGGRAILFSETLTSIDGNLYARGGEEGGDGGFIETSGLRNFSITAAPDASATAGNAGEWLIDPFDITIVATREVTACETAGAPCLSNAVEAILRPNFDSAGFDDILRTVDPAFEGIPTANELEAQLLVRALSVGINVTLSTEAFEALSAGDTPQTTPPEFGDINVNAAILIPDGGAAPGTRATLTLLASGDININADILVGDGDLNVTPDMSLNLDFRANDQTQTDANAEFAVDQIQGSVNIDGDIRTGGGDFTATGISIQLAANLQLNTDGGDAAIISGTLDRFSNPATFQRTTDTQLASQAPGIRIEGTIDTSRPADDPTVGGSLTLEANSILVATTASGAAPLSVEVAELYVSGTLRSGGANMTLLSGSSGTVNAGSVEIDGATLSSAAGEIKIDANHLDPDSTIAGGGVDFVNESGRGQGGEINITMANVATEGGNLTIGSAYTQHVSMDGVFDTTGGAGGENGLMSIVAVDQGASENDTNPYGQGLIEVGANGAATLESAGISFIARDVLFSNSGATNPVVITATGNSSSDQQDSELGIGNANDPQTIATVGEVSITGDRQIVFHENTQITADTIDIVAAQDSTRLTDDEPTSPDELTRLTFEGTGSNDVTEGVRLQANTITMSVGDGTTVTSDLENEDLETDGAPSEFALTRETRGHYTGLQLRDQAGSARPENLTIQQDGDLTVSQTAPEDVAGELFFGGRSGTTVAGGAFDDADIGTQGQRIILESRDGIVRVEEAAGLNSDGGVVPGNDAGRSWVTLNGGLLLSTGGMLANSVEFNIDDMSAELFDVEALTVTTPRDFTVDDAILSEIGAANELTFIAGRNVALNLVLNDPFTLTGNLTVAAGTTLSATDLVSLQAAARGFGDLEFLTSMGMTTRINSNNIDLRAGAGSETENSDAATRAQILGAATVEYRDNMGNPIQGDATIQRSFSFRQDDAIVFSQDDESAPDTDLPTLSNFGLVGSSFGAAAVPVQYSLRSDFGSLDLTSGDFDASQVRHTSISLIGSEAAGLAIQLPDGFIFDGYDVTLGGVSSFTMSQDLATAFTAFEPVGETKQVTLMSGLNDVGSLTMAPGALIRAPRIALIAGDGTGGNQGSTISTAGANFDLQDSDPNDRRFTFQNDAAFAFANLPTIDQFAGGLLPSVLAIRNDAGLIDLSDPDWTTLPLDLSQGARLILEADAINLRGTAGDNLNLTGNNDDAAKDAALANLHLRIRTNDLLLQTVTGSEASPGTVLAGLRAGDTVGEIMGTTDSAFDGEHLLIEGFTDSQHATTDNLSTLSQDATDPSLVDFSSGQGPSTIIVSQDADITSEELFQRFDVAGLLGQSTDPDLLSGDPAPTRVRLVSTFGDIAFNSDNVSGGQLDIGFANLPLIGDITFEAGGADPYTFTNAFAFTEGEITVEADADITATDTLQLEAGISFFNSQTAITEANPVGRLIFETSGAAETDLTANTLILRAGPTGPRTNPDADGDGVRDDIGSCTDTSGVTCNSDNPFEGLSFIEFEGLNSISVGDTMSPSSFTATQSADMVTTLVTAALVAGGSEWNDVDLASVQGNTTVTNIADLATATQNVSLGRTTDLSKQLILEENGIRPDLFSVAAGFEGQVRLESNNVLFRALGVSDLQLESPNLRFVSETFRTIREDQSQLGRIGSDPDVLDRPIIRIEQSGDYSTTLLPRGDRFFQLGILFTNEIGIFRRASRERLAIDLMTTGDTFMFTNDIRDGVADANVSISAGTPGGQLIFDVTELAPGIRDYTFDGTSDLDIFDFPVVDVNSIEITGFEEIVFNLFTPEIPGLGPTRTDFFLASAGDQFFGGETVLGETLIATGRDIRFEGDIYRGATAPTDVGLIIGTSGTVTFEENIGFSGDGPLPTTAPTEQLSQLWVLFDSEVVGRTPTVQFGQRIDSDGDGIAETPVDSDQAVFVDTDIVFVSTPLSSPDDPADRADGNRLLEDLMASIEGAASIGALQTAFDTFDIGRVNLSPVATIGKAEGDLTFQTDSGGNFVMGSGERIAVGGDLTINYPDQIVTLGDAAALNLSVDAAEIALVLRNSGVTVLPDGATTQDGGSWILANTIDFGDATPTVSGAGRLPRFGVPDAFDPALPAFLSAFSVGANRPDNSELTSDDFRFVSANLDQVASPLATGASRSELTGAFGPEDLATFDLNPRDIAPLTDPERLTELDVSARSTSAAIRIARLLGDAIIDDLGLISTNGLVAVTEARLDANDAEAAIALYESLFGSDGGQSENVRNTLQEALDRYLETTRARRVIGFELRRFVKNRPSTLFEAYQTLDQLDQLFRYHRRLGLSPGEFRKIQAEWIAAIQPEGISLDELAEAIHPSRYVRGSDILDIFGR